MLGTRNGWRREGTKVNQPIQRPSNRLALLLEVQSVLTMQYSLSRQHGVLGTRWYWEGRNSALTLCVREKVTGRLVSEGEGHKISWARGG